MPVSSTYTDTITAANAQAGAKAGAAAAVAPANALSKLTGNFDDFLTLLTTQLKNQDPTSPMDTNQFTAQLVQFTAVAEQINTNATLGKLLTATVAQQLGQASSLVGREVSFSGGALPLQDGAARVDFQSLGEQQVQVIVSDASGAPVRSEMVSAANGANTWTWDGTAAGGRQMPDGAYNVAVTAAGAAVPFQAFGTVTGAEQSGQNVQLKLGAAGIGFDKLVAFTAPKG